MERLTRAQEEAKAKLILAIKEAVLVGLDVDKFFVDTEGKLKTLDTQLLCLKLAVCNAFFGTTALYAIKIYCAINKYAIDLPEAVFVWQSVLTTVSIVGFGFKLVRLPKWLGGSANYVQTSDNVDITFPSITTFDPGGQRGTAEEKPVRASEVRDLLYDEMGGDRSL